MDPCMSSPDLTPVHHAPSGGLSGSRGRRSHDMRSKKRSRDKSLTQISLEEAWGALYEQLRRFKNEAKKTLITIGNAHRIRLGQPPLTSPSGMSSLSSRSSSPDLDKMRPIVNPIISQEIKTSLMAESQRSGSSIVGMEEDAGLVAGDDMDLEGTFTGSTSIKEGEEFLSEQELDDWNDGESVQQLMEESSEWGGGSAGALEDTDRAPQYERMHTRINTKSQNHVKSKKIVRFQDGLVGMKYGTEDGHPERINQKQLLSLVSQPSTMVRPQFTRKDVKELEKLLGESNGYSLLRLRRRVGLEPRRSPNLEFVTWPRPK